MKVIGSLECKLNASGRTLIFLIFTDYEGDLVCSYITAFLLFSLINILRMFLLTDDPDAPQSLHYRNDVTTHVVFKEVIQCSRMLFVTITLQMIWKKTET